MITLPVDVSINADEFSIYSRLLYSKLKTTKISIK